MPSSLVNLANICYSLPSGESLIADCSLSIHQRLSGIVGRNGIGKTSLAKILCGEIKPDSGTVQVSGNLAYVPQVWPGSQQDSVARVLGLEANSSAHQRIERGSVNAVDFELAAAYWDSLSKIESLCNSMTQTPPDLNRCIGTYSGGEQIIIMLLQALLKESDILVLDEPNNHLDSENRIKMINWMKTTSSAIILISHDAEFLGVVDEIWELTGVGIFNYSGGYLRFLEERQKRIQLQEDELTSIKRQTTLAAKKSQERLKKHQQRVARGRNKSVKTGLSKIEIGGAKERASSSIHSIKMIDRHRQATLEDRYQSIRRDYEIIEPIQFELPHSFVPPEKIVLKMEKLQWGYSTPLQAPLSLCIKGTQRIHLRGRNGSGKTSLLKTILEEISPLSGHCELKVRAAYLKQHHYSFVQFHSVLEEFRIRSPGLTEQDYHDRLAWMGMRGKETEKPVHELSGGNKLKLALAIALLGEKTPQLLLLDEPSNHLDLYARKALIQALANFSGSMIVVSHDKSFVEELGCDREIQLER